MCRLHIHIRTRNRTCTCTMLRSPLVRAEHVERHPTHDFHAPLDYSVVRRRNVTLQSPPHTAKLCMHQRAQHCPQLTSPTSSLIMITMMMSHLIPDTAQRVVIEKHIERFFVSQQHLQSKPRHGKTETAQSCHPSAPKEH